MTFEEACNEINSLISRNHNSHTSPLSGEDYTFERIKTYSLSELLEFEARYGITLPAEYKYFLMNVGASKIYLDEFELGIEFLPLEQLMDFSSEVFKGMKNPFPNILIIASNIGRGDFISYGVEGENKDYRLATFSHEEDPERWLQDNTKWSSLKDWLVTLVESEGEKDTI